MEQWQIEVSRDRVSWVLDTYSFRGSQAGVIVSFIWACSMEPHADLRAGGQ